MTLGVVLEVLSSFEKSLRGWIAFEICFQGFDH